MVKRFVTDSKIGIKINEVPDSKQNAIHTRDWMAKLGLM
jgi:hypothetical protein